LSLEADHSQQEVTTLDLCVFTLTLPICEHQISVLMDRPQTTNLELMHAILGENLYGRNLVLSMLVSDHQICWFVSEFDVNFVS
jgi:hypothetical protein